jgi:hypothetical protein
MNQTKESTIYLLPNTYVRVKIRKGAKRDSISGLIKRAVELFENEDLIEIKGERNSEGREG